MENLTPETRLEGYLAKMTGQTSETLEPKTRLEYYLNKIAENSGGTSELETVEVTIVNGSASRTIIGSLPNTRSIDSTDLSVGEIAVNAGETETFTAITYKGKCGLAFIDSPYFNFATVGDAEALDEGTYLITGNCTITVSDKPVV